MKKVLPFCFSHIRLLTLICGVAILPLSSFADEEETPDLDETQLDELVVVQQQKLVSSDGATLTYNVTEDPEAGSSNILEILRKVPGVTVDAEDNVKVNGQSNFQILMNGREDPMLKGDIKTILKSLPAASIKKIEVISEPGAKYDAEGVGGILNIVTDKSKKLEGFFAQAGAWVNAYQAGGYLSGRKQVKNVMLDARVTYNNGNVWPRSSYSERRSESLNGSINHLLTSKSKYKSGWDYTGVNLNMSWEPDSLNLFTLSANYGYNTWNSQGEEDRQMQAPDLSVLWKLRRNYDSDGKYNSVNAQVSYQHNFGRDDHNIVASYMYWFGHQRNIVDYFTDQITGLLTDPPFSGSRSKSNYIYNIIQVDYSNRFSPKHLLEAGTKIYLNHNGGDNVSYYGITASEAEEDASSVLDMTQIRDIYAAYASYTGTFSKWNVKAGLRYELTRMGLRYKVGNYDDFTSYLHDLVPNAAISYNLTTASNIRLAYQLRISRPDISQINPFINNLNPGQIEYGNPDLQSEKGHTFSLGYSNYEGKISGSAKLTYRYVNNAVNDVIFIRDGIINSTYENIGYSHLAMLDLSADWNINSKLRWSIYASGTYNYLKAESEMLKATNHGWQTYLSTDLNYTHPSKWRLNVNAGMWTPWIDLQGKGEQTGYYYGVGVSKSWLRNEALTLSMNLNNILPTFRRSGYRQEDSTLRVIQSQKYKQWNVGVSVTYKIGGLTAGVKRTVANIETESSAGGNSKGK